MRFKIKSNEQYKHSEMVNSVTWSASNELFRFIKFIKVFLMIK